MSAQLDYPATAGAETTAAAAPARRFDALPVLAAAVLLGHAPLVSLHLRSLWQREQYQYFPFVIAAVGGLLITRWREAPAVEVEPRGRRLPWLLLGMSACMLAGSLPVFSGWLAMVSLNVALGATFLWLRQRRAMSSLVGIWCLLWLLVPAPLGVDEPVIHRLQLVSSKVSSLLLDAIGVLHVMSGNVLTLNSKELFVDEACSGIISVMSIVAVSMVYAVWNNRSLVHLVLLTIVGVAWAVIMNVLRICCIAVAEFYWQYDLASDSPYHGALSLTVFLGTFLALMCTDRLLLVALAAIGDDVGQPHYGVWLSRLWDCFIAGGSTGLALKPQATRYAGENRRPPFSWPLATTAIAAFLTLGFLQLLLSGFSDAGADRAVDRALACNGGSVPSRIGLWRLEKCDAVERDLLSYFGRYSRTYLYRNTTRPEQEATISLDFPFTGGWHELSNCYRSSGWIVNEWKEVEEGGAWPYVDACLWRPEGIARTIFAQFDTDGEIVEPVSLATQLKSWFIFRRRFLRQYAPQLFQVQVFAAGEWTDDPEAAQELQQLLETAREQFRRQVAGSE